MKKKNKFDSFTGVLSIGLTNGVCLVVGLGIGYKFDSYFHSAPWGICIGLCVGFLAGFLESYRQITRAIDELAKEKQSKGKNESSTRN